MENYRWRSGTRQGLGWLMLGKSKSEGGTETMWAVQWGGHWKGAEEKRIVCEEQKKETKLAITEVLVRGHQCVALRVISRTTGSWQRFIPLGVGSTGKAPTSSMRVFHWQCWGLGVLRLRVLWDFKLIWVSDLIVLKSPELRLWDFPLVAKLVPWITGSWLQLWIWCTPRSRLEVQSQNTFRAQSPAFSLSLTFNQQVKLAEMQI